MLRFPFQTEIVYQNIMQYVHVFVISSCNLHLMSIIFIEENADFLFYLEWW